VNILDKAEISPYGVRSRRRSVFAAVQGATPGELPGRRRKVGCPKPGSAVMLQLLVLLWTPVATFCASGAR
jgi:hypothetical protein